MNPEIVEIDLATCSEAQLTLYLARQGMQPSDTQKSLDKAMERVKRAKAVQRDERPWEELELEKVLPWTK